MTNAEAQAALEACEKATSGPWSMEFCLGGGANLINGRSVIYPPEDAHFCALARTALPAALADRAELLAGLRQFEWLAPRAGEPYCAHCGYEKRIGHKETCGLAELLRRMA